MLLLTRSFARWVFLVYICDSVVCMDNSKAQVFYSAEGVIGELIVSELNHPRSRIECAIICLWTQDCVGVGENANDPDSCVLVNKTWDSSNEVHMYINPGWTTYYFAGM